MRALFAAVLIAAAAFPALLSRFAGAVWHAQFHAAQWPRGLLTDSGGFQMVSLLELAKVVAAPRGVCTPCVCCMPCVCC